MKSQLLNFNCYSGCEEGGKFRRTCVQNRSFNWVYNDIAYLVAYSNVFKNKEINMINYLPVFKSIFFSNLNSSFI